MKTQQAQQVAAAVRTYKRQKVEGGCYFFTVNLANRQHDDLLVREIEALRDALRQTRADHPFEIDAIVVLPEHLHTIWQLPPHDSDFSTRWRLIKSRFAQAIKAGEHISESRLKKGERGIWQRRFWEHLIRDDMDYARHVDYIHYNPVKHGHCARAADWQHSSFQRWVDQGIYSIDWAAADATRELSFE
ncbi:MAG: transposase [Burkholderiales bacterium]